MAETTKVQQKDPPLGDHPNEALTKCLFQQYAATFAGVSCGTAYALAKRRKNGMGIMLVAGAGGSIVDLVYGWNVTCAQQVEDWYQQDPQQQQPGGHKKD